MIPNTFCKLFFCCSPFHFIFLLFLISTLYGTDCWLLQLHNRFYSRLVHHHHTFKYVDSSNNKWIIELSSFLHSFSFSLFCFLLFPLINRRYAKINRFIHFGDIPSQTCVYTQCICVLLHVCMDKN